MARRENYRRPKWGWKPTPPFKPEWKGHRCEWCHRPLPENKHNIQTYEHGGYGTTHHFCSAKCLEAHRRNEVQDALRPLFADEVEEYRAAGLLPPLPPALPPPGGVAWEGEEEDMEDAPPAAAAAAAAPAAAYVEEDDVEETDEMRARMAVLRENHRLMQATPQDDPLYATYRAKVCMGAAFYDVRTHGALIIDPLSVDTWWLGPEAIIMFFVDELRRAARDEAQYTSRYNALRAALAIYNEFKPGVFTFGYNDAPVDAALVERLSRDAVVGTHGDERYEQHHAVRLAAQALHEYHVTQAARRPPPIRSTTEDVATSAEVTRLATALQRTPRDNFRYPQMRGELTAARRRLERIWESIPAELRNSRDFSERTYAYESAMDLSDLVLDSTR